jgi:hypothetical protein
MMDVRCCFASFYHHATTCHHFAHLHCPFSHHFFTLGFKSFMKLFYDFRVFFAKLDALPSSLIDSNVNLKWTHWKSKESGHVPWLTTFWGWKGVLEL